MIKFKGGIMYRLIVSDLDGTLLRDDNTLSEYTKSIIHKVSQQGIEFMLATGRIFGGAKGYAKELNLDTPILSCNGALIKGTDGTVIYGKHIEPSPLTEVFHLLQGKELYFHFYGEENFYTRKLTDYMSRFYDLNKKLEEQERFPIIEVDPFEVAGKDSIYKVLAHCGTEEHERNELYELLKAVPGISVTSSWSNTFDICADQVNKGIAIERYAAEKGINPSEILCFGDNFNDLEMIQYAGMGVAVENAVTLVKETANYVTLSNNEDGVAKAIEKLILS
ncbi:HAD family phosphatase [Anoxybacterium hadale]|uniref:HAD family phosphatase n=1 Tax=Anoxybacterium hadale TaxID=3408580 RepID=A0ACD1AGD6_9FIRM|nr:HAD family phosphatase [Clostridiales bacterium]